MTSRIKTIFGLTTALALAWRVMTNRRVPLWVKALPLLAIGYTLLPRDLAPDIVTIIGRLDDLIVTLALLYLFLRFGSAALAILDARRGGSPGKAGREVEGRYRIIERE